MAVATRPRTEVPINLLPPQIRQQQRVNRIFRFVVAGAVALGVLLITITVAQRLQISSTERTLAEERAEAARLRGKVAELKEFEVLDSSVKETRQLLSTALTNDVSWSRFLDDLDTVMPGDSWFTGLKMTAAVGQTPLGESSLGTVNFQGFVMSFPGLSGWLDTMEKLDGLRFVYLSNGNKQDQNGTEVVNFSASAHLTETMLSGRCMKEGAPCP